jgi:hypothetical protein
VRLEKVADVAVEILTGRVQNVAGRQVHQLRGSLSPGAPYVRRTADDATCWRAALHVNSPHARRIHPTARSKNGRCPGTPQCNRPRPPSAAGTQPPTAPAQLRVDPQPRHRPSSRPPAAPAVADTRPNRSKRRSLLSPIPTRRPPHG